MSIEVGDRVWIVTPHERDEFAKRIEEAQR